MTALDYEITPLDKDNQSDIEVVVKIWQHGNQDAQDFFPETYWQGKEAAFRKTLQTVNACVAHQGDKFLGFIVVDGTQVVALYVAHTFRGQGVGQALLAKAQKGKDNLTMNVFNKNIKAYRFAMNQKFRVASDPEDPETHELQYHLIKGDYHFQN